MEKEQYIVALEVGSSKIVGAIATVNFQGGISVIALEEEKVVDCVRYGCIQNVEEANTRINRIIKNLEKRSAIYPRKIKGVFVGVSGRSLRNITTEVERILDEETTITANLIEDIKKESIRTPVNGFDILDSVPYKYILDKSEVKTPVGTIGSHILVNLNLIVSKPQIKVNLKRVIEERLQLAVKGYIVTPLCTAQEVLTNDERQLGCVLLDFGAETTTISIYKSNVLISLCTLPLGSRNITRDLTALNLVEEKAESIKKAVGNAIPSDNGDSSQLSIEGINTNDVTNYIVARTEEIVANINAQIFESVSNPDNIPGGIVVIGNGTKLKGFTILLEQTTKLRVRIGHANERVNILERGISTTDYPQIISLLTKGASLLAPNDACCEMPIVPLESASSQPVVNPEPKIEIAQKQKKGNSIFGKVVKGLKNAVDDMFKDDGNDEEDDDTTNNKKPARK